MAFRRWDFPVLFLLLAWLSAWLLPAATGLAAPPRAQTVLAHSDAVRNPDRPFRLINTLTEFRRGRAFRSLTLMIYSKIDAENGQYRTLVRWMAPPRDRGKLSLKDGNLMWFFDPTSKSSVRLSARQRLMGQAANGDVMTVNLHLDYDAEWVGVETVTDADRRSRSCHHLDLRARHDGVTYDRIDYWVDEQNFMPVKGKYYSASGRLLKLAFFRRAQHQLGRERPTEALIIDGVDPSLVTRMTFTDYAYRDIPEHWFSRGYLPHFRGD